MRIRVLYFAAVRDLAARSEEALDLPDDVRTIAALARHLETHVPALAGRLAQVRFARNEDFAAPEQALAEGDVIALIPPVAGG